MLKEKEEFLKELKDYMTNKESNGELIQPTRFKHKFKVENLSDALENILFSLWCNTKIIYSSDLNKEIQEELNNYPNIKIEDDNINEGLKGYTNIIVFIEDIKNNIEPLQKIIKENFDKSFTLFINEDVDLLYTEYKNIYSKFAYVSTITLTEVYPDLNEETQPIQNNIEDSFLTLNIYPINTWDAITLSDTILKNENKIILDKFI